jgi:YHS domain-containing protein
MPVSLFRRTHLVAALLLMPVPLLAQSSAPSASATPTSTAWGAGRGVVNTDDAGLALKGHDPVAYQLSMQATVGSPAITATHEGATYRFATVENRDRFVADPARYAPVYGGYCAMGVTGGRKFDIDPQAFTVVDGRLYMNKDMRTRAAWMRDIPGHNARADANWPRVQLQRGF